MRDQLALDGLAWPAPPGFGPPIAHLERPGGKPRCERAAGLSASTHVSLWPWALRKLRVKELRKICDDEGIDIKGLTEKDEIVKKIHDKFGIKSEL